MEIVFLLKLSRACMRLLGELFGPLAIVINDEQLTGDGHCDELKAKRLEHGEGRVFRDGICP